MSEQETDGVAVIDGGQDTGDTPPADTVTGQPDDVSGDNDAQSSPESNGSSDQGGEEKPWHETSWYNPDSWRDPVVTALVDDGWDEAKAKDHVGKYTSPADAALHHGRIEKKLHDRNLVPLPHEGMSDEDKTRFRQKWGMPQEAVGENGYKFETPEGIEMDDHHQGQIDQFQERAFERNMSQSQFSDTINDYFGMLQATWSEESEKAARVARESDDKLRLEWGKDYESQKELNNAYLQEKGIDPDYLESTIVGGTALKSDYKFNKLLAAITTDYYGEGQFIEGESTSGTNPQQKIDEIMQLYRAGLQDKSKMDEYKRREPELDKWDKLLTKREQMKARN